VTGAFSANLSYVTREWGFDRGFAHFEDYPITVGGLIESTAFDVIVCDVMMPELTGVDVYEQLRARHPGRERTMLFMTGGTFTPRAQRFLDAVANPCIEKPFAPPALRALVRERVG